MPFYVTIDRNPFTCLSTHYLPEEQTVVKKLIIKDFLSTKNPLIFSEGLLNRKTSLLDVYYFLVWLFFKGNRQNPPKINFITVINIIVCIVNTSDLFIKEWN